MCGDKYHLKRGCPKKTFKSLQKSALAAVKKKCIGPKSVNLNLILKENLFWETPSMRPPPHPPGPLQQKLGANSIFSLKPSTSGSAALDRSALNSFTLKQPPLEYLLDFLGPFPHKPSVFYLADLVWLNRQEGQGSPNGKNRPQVSDIFIYLK